ncbi:hypothetical protein J2Y69_003328 [Microbacterium resistens]|uniref:Uncharacterized protein n=1 Tax=Microbacterium resistens TaxID=156977 RepID=A0ABU1SGG3_9MICO|nr:hypothetical protein [Microbacterium resistens]MDR6868704.1 hypothetical protein [Microbacterium resistens]
MSALAERPEPPQPGSLASSPLDKALTAMQSAPCDPAKETPADYFARIVTARSLNAARGEGLSIHAAVGAMGRQLVAIAALLPVLPSPEDLEAELALLDTIPTGEEPSR